MKNDMQGNLSTS